MQNKTDKSVEVVAKHWKANPYYERAEQFTYIFWRDQNPPFKVFFDRLDLGNVIELACGHGRHTAQFVHRAGHVTLSDIHQENLDAARARLKEHDNVSFALSDGRNIPAPDGSATGVFCYDAMVHFAPEVIFSYLAEIERVLIPGAMALLHHSNYDAPIDSVWTQNPHGRNRMTQSMFRSGAEMAGLEIIEMLPIPWGSEQIDCISLVRKPMPADAEGAP